MADSLKKSVDDVISTIRGRRESAEPVSIEAEDATSVEASAAEIVTDVPQLHLASAAAEAAEKTRGAGPS